MDLYCFGKRELVYQDCQVYQVYKDWQIRYFYFLDKLD
jgi:hypothetical protein